MTRTFRFAIVVGLFALAGLAFPSGADAQRRGGGAARSHGAVRPGGAIVRGGGGHVGGRVAVPRTYSSYYRPYYGRPYFYRPYYGAYYPYRYSTFSLSVGFGFGWYGGSFSAPLYGYPYYSYPYAAYPAYPYPYSSAAPYAYPPQYPSQQPYPAGSSDSGYVNPAPANAPNGYQTELRTTTGDGDDRGAFGTVSIRVRPGDATILIDQQAWDASSGEERFSIEVAEGSHHIEIRKAGYTTYVRTIDVTRGRPVVLNVALTPRGGATTTPVARTVPLRH